MSSILHNRYKRTELLTLLVYNLGLLLILCGIGLFLYQRGGMPQLEPVWLAIFAIAAWGVASGCARRHYGASDGCTP